MSLKGFWDTLLIRSQQTHSEGWSLLQNIWDSLSHHSTGCLYVSLCICSSETVSQLIWQKMVSAAFLWEPQNCLRGKEFVRKSSSNAKQKQWFGCLGLKRAECLHSCVWIQDGVSPISNPAYHKKQLFLFSAGWDETVPIFLSEDFTVRELPVHIFQS